MRVAGLEPARPDGQELLRLSRLPLRHTRINRFIESSLRKRPSLPPVYQTVSLEAYKLTMVAVQLRGEDEAPAPAVRAQALDYERDQVFGDVEISWAVPEALRVVLAVQMVRQLQALTKICIGCSYHEISTTRLRLIGIGSRQHSSHRSSSTHNFTLA